MLLLNPYHEKLLVTSRSSTQNINNSNHPFLAITSSYLPQVAFIYSQDMLCFQQATDNDS